MSVAITKEELSEFWRQVIDPNGIGMAKAIAGEIASYTGESVSSVLLRMENGKRDLKALWEKSKPNVSNISSVESFYRDQFVEAYELANWHCGREDGKPPLNYAYAANFVQQKGLRRVLDFGSGIGTGSLCLASIGCEVHAADIAKQLLNFVGHRVRARGHRIDLIDLNETRPCQNYYDLIVCFDVLEHVPDQLSKLRELSSYLEQGGYLLVNLMEDSTHPEMPMHISSAKNMIAILRQTDLIPEWSDRPVGLQVLVRKPYGHLWNYTASWKEWLQGV